MKSFLYQFIFTGIFFGMMDALWFGLFMRDFAISRLGPILKMKDGQLAAHMPSALIAYMMMVLVAVLFLFPRLNSDMSLIELFSLGFMMGLTVFGVFDFTNSALITPYPFSFAIIDSLWGGFLYGCLAMVYSKLATYLM